MRKIRLGCLILILLFFAGILSSQETEKCLVTTATAEGVTPLGSYKFGTIDTVNLQNGNLVLNIPLLSIDGRGIDAGISLVYNSRIWKWRDPVKPTLPPICVMIPQRYDGLPVGWQLSIPKMKYRQIPTYYDKTYTEYTLLENGAAHNFTNELKISSGGGITKHIQKGYTFDSTYMTFNIPNSSLTNYVIKRDGTAIFFRGLFGRPSRYPLKIEDKNGNFISFFLGSEEGYAGDVANLITSIEDTQGRRIRFNYDENARLTSIEYVDTNGAIRRIQFQYGTVRIEWDGKDWGNPYQHVSYDTIALSKIILPNGLAYEFEYDTALNQGRGQVTSIILPTGGKLRHTYGKSQLPGESMLYDVVIKKEEIENQISNTGQYQYSCPNPHGGPGTYPLTTSAIDALGNQIKHTFMSITDDGDIVEAKREIFEGSGESGTLIRKVILSWDTGDSFQGPVSESISKSFVCVNPRVTTETMYLYDTSPPQGHAVSYSYRINPNPRYCPDGNPIEIRERKFSGEVYIPENSVLLKKKLLEYLHSTNTAYYNFNLLDLLSKERTLDPSGNTVSERRFEYDGFSLTSAAAIHHETPVNGNYRGNPTRTISKLFTGSDIITENYYDVFGNAIKSKDGRGNEIVYTYTSNNHFAYPEVIINSKGHQTSYTYSLHTGALLSSTDPNGNRTELFYDLMGRLREVRNPDGGGSTYTYNDTLPLSIMTSTKLSAGRSLVSHVFYDGFGRPHLTRTADPEGDVLTGTSYDPLGRKSRESNPYRDGESPSFTEYQNDALGRITKTTYPDGNFIEYQYSGYLTKAYDQTGRWREFQYDPLGDLISVNENGLNTTSYQYGVLGNLLQVSQGDRIRTFAYDSLSRLISETHPESGAASYIYDFNSNLIDKTDSRAIHTSYTYDSLDRALSKSYTDSTPAVNYSYDGENLLGVTSQNPKGRLTGISVPRLKEAYSYDKMGRLINEVKEIDGQRFEISYAYDLAGNLISEVYPSGRAISREMNSAGRITRLRDETRVRDVISGISYAPFGAISQKTCGNGLINTISFNNRLQPTRIKHGNVVDLSYAYYDSNGKNNGNVIGIADNTSPSKSTGYAYDALNRLMSASSPAWSQAFNYDIYGNVLSKQGTGGAPSAAFTYSQKNQINGFNYDPNGNLISDGTHSFNYDANNQIKDTGVHVYVYDSKSNRAIKEKNIVPKEVKYYIYDKNGLPIAEYLKTGSNPVSWKKDLIYLGSNLVQSAENPSSQTFSLPPADIILYYHQDHLGNNRIVTAQNGSIVETHDFYPFGEEIATQPQNKDQYLFTGKPRDMETGLDYFGARHYSSAIGRFFSPDIAPPNYKDPQTLNGYSYCRNNPVRYLDPTGEYGIDVHYYLTYTLAVLSGFSKEEAQIIATFNQYVDDNSATTADPCVSLLGAANKTQRREWHFNPDGGEAAFSRAVEYDSLVFFGAALHVMQDSRHAHGKMVAEGKTGHAWEGKAPDRTSADPTTAGKMTAATLQTINRFRSMMGLPVILATFDKITNELLEKFNKETDPKKKISILEEILGQKIPKYQRPNAWVMNFVLWKQAGRAQNPGWVIGWEITR